MSAKKKVLMNSVLYTISSVIVKGIAFLLLPIYTRVLTVADYGITNMVNSFVNVSIIVVSLSLAMAVFRFYSDYKDDLEEYKKLVGTIVIFVIGTSIAFFAFTFLSKSVLSKYILKGVDFYPYIAIALFILFFSIMYTIHQSILQTMQQGKKIIIIGFGVFGLTVVLNLLFLLVFDLGALGIILSQMCVYGTFTIYAVYDLRKSNLITFTFEIKYIKKALYYSVPLIPHQLSLYIASFTAKIFINNNTSMGAVGLYSLANQFTSVTELVQTSINRAVQPWIFEVLSKDDEEEFNQTKGLVRLVLIGVITMLVFIGVFVQEAIIIVTTPDFYLAWTVIPILLTAYSFKAIYYHYTNIIMYYIEASQKLFIATTIGSIVNILLAYILVLKLSIMGAAIAFAISKLVIVFIIASITKKYAKFRYELWPFFKIAIIGNLFMYVGLIFSYSKFQEEVVMLNFLYKVLIFLGYCLTIALLHRKELVRYWGLIKVSKKYQEVINKIKIRF